MTRKRSLENELNTLCNNKYKGAQIRSKARWEEEGEKNTGYFLSLEAKHQTANVIREVVCDDGKRVNTDNEVLGEMCNFYKKLYSSNSISDISIENYFENIENICRLKDEDKQLCDVFPSMQEC